MKNTQKTMVLILISIIGIHSHASAQLLPANIAVLTNNSVVLAPAEHTAVVLNQADPLVDPVIEAVNPGLQVNEHTVINSLQASQGLSTTLINQNGISLISEHATGENLQVLIQEGNNSGLVTNNQGAINQSTSGGSNGQNQSGSFSGTNFGYHSANPVQQISTTNTARPAVYAATYKTVAKKVAKKEMIALIPEDTLYGVSDQRSQNDFSASVQGVSGQMTLIGILIAIAGILGLVVSVKEYRIRNQVKQGVHYA